MTHTYNISGMTCNSCVGRVKSELFKLGDVIDADVQMNTPQATITMQKHIPVAELQKAVNKAGRFVIDEKLQPLYDKMPMAGEIYLKFNPALMVM